MRKILNITGVLLAAAMLLTGCQGDKEKYTFRETGIGQLNAGSYEEAIQSFDQALEHSDGLVGTFELDVLKYRAEAEYKAEDYAAAAHTYEVLIHVDEPRQEYADMQNMLYISAGELDKALAAYQAAYGPEKESAGDGEKKSRESILLSLGQALAEANRFEEARTLYLQAITDGIASGELYNRMGLGELENGNLDQALDYFEKGSQLPDAEAQPKLLYNRAAVYERKQDYAKALELLQTYVSNYGATPEVDKEIAFLKTRR